MQGGMGIIKEGRFMIINHNMSAIYANRILKFKNLAVDKDIAKLSSGERITRAGDDASGLAVSLHVNSWTIWSLYGENSEDRRATP